MIRARNTEQSKARAQDQAQRSQESGTGSGAAAGYSMGADFATIGRNAGLRGDQVRKFTEVFGDILNDAMAQFNVEASLYRGNNRAFLDAWAGTQNAAVERAAEIARNTPVQGGATAARGAAGQATGAGQRVEIVLNGRTTPVNVASAGDVQALTKILQQLADASMRAA